ncbi:MAG: T9SS type A sorting domain-containing protein [Bacteroidaceae bacterium]|nr:T9SS type A sorting domain-containing protein [Bacteroidaceae bacterium]
MERKKKVFFSLLMSMGVILSVVAQTPTTPTNLQADIDGCMVSLSWQRGGDDTLITYEGFENEAFPSEGWETKKLNTTDYRCSWFHYPSDDFKELDNWDWYINSGEGSTMVYMDMGYHEGIAYNQDEWLISPIYDNAMYLDFWYYINPMLLEYAQYSDFVDKYCVELSRDGGQTWEIVWDARNHHNGLDEWQQASLYLGAPTPNTRIAFHAQSDMESEWSMLYFSWSIDDVMISSNGSSGNTTQSIKKKNCRKTDNATKSFRVFESNETPNKNCRYAIKEETAPLSYYQVFLNGELIADKLCSLNYADITDKEAGTYTYEVKAVNEHGVSDAASLQVDIAESTFNPPTNVKVTSQYYEEKGWGEVTISWDAPEGERQPAFYVVYVNDVIAGNELPLGEMGNSWVGRGIYTYEVAAVYNYPYGESERIGDQVAMNTHYTPRNLNAILDNGSVALSWQAAKASDTTIEAYKVYRGNSEIASITPNMSLTYTDSDVNAGYYTYSVKALYNDGQLSLPTQCSILAYDWAITELPYTQNFDGDLTPDNWAVEMLNGIDPMFKWRFDNWFEIETSCTDIEGNFASLSSEANEFLNIISSITTPLFDNSNIPEGESVMLSCTIDYYSIWDFSYFGLEVSTDCGETWEWYADIYYADITDYKYETDITSVTKDATPMFRFVYDGCGDGYVIIDNFKVYVTDNLSVEDNLADNTEVSMIDGSQLKILSTSAIERICLYNTSGMLVKCYEGNKQCRQIINLSELHKGLYIVKVKCADNTIDKKVIVN